ncbi:MAG TPA: amidohydrolase family protein [Actinopolymorphaceae bacterium]|nr:amidohydrolase family protein [Actinopolymorphaceae bacterium]
MSDPLRDAVLAGRALTGVRVVDAHAHLGSYGRFFIPTPDAATMVRLMDRCGVAQAVLSSCLAFAQDAGVGNEETARAVETHPARLLGYVVANPHQGLDREICRWADHPGMVGVKLHPDVHKYPLTGPAYDTVWEFAARAARPVLTHTWAGSPYSDLAQVHEVARADPEVRLVAGHAGALRTAFRQMIDVARQCPNLYLEICGSEMTGPWIAAMVEALGSHRVLYGSDFPFIDLRYSLGRVVFANLALTDRHTVLGGAMATLLATATTPDGRVTDEAYAPAMCGQSESSNPFRR